jgi:hypothetical protein
MADIVGAGTAVIASTAQGVLPSDGWTTLDDTLAGSASGFSDMTAEAGVLYEYQVVAVNGTGYTPSNTASATANSDGQTASTTAAVAAFSGQDATPQAGAATGAATAATSAFAGQEATGSSSGPGAQTGVATAAAVVATAQGANRTGGPVTVATTASAGSLTARSAIAGSGSGIGARSFESATPDFLTGAWAPTASTGSLTFGVWYYLPASVSYRTAISLGADDRANIHVLNIGASHFGGYIAGNGSSNVNFESDATPEIGTWRFVAVRYDSTNGVVKLVHHGVEAGGGGTLSGSRRDPGARTTVGGRRTLSNTGGSQYWDGLLAHVAVWERAVPTSELLDMATNFKSPLYYANNLVAYFPLDGAGASPELDRMTANALTVSGSATTAPGPGLIDPPIPQTTSATAAFSAQTAARVAGTAYRTATAATVAFSGQTITGSAAGPATQVGQVSAAVIGATVQDVSTYYGLYTVSLYGSIYNPLSGTKWTSGRLNVRPLTFIVSNGNLVSTNTVYVYVPPTGDLSFQLVPGNYQTEFDPNPSDTATPLKRKSGYFKNQWTVPTTGPVDIATL